MSKKAGAELKAYHVQGEEHGCIAFAASNVVARRNGANELDYEFGSVTCTRAGQFDEFAAYGKVPVRALLAAGWWWECTACHNTVYGSDDELVDGEDVYCCEACRDATFASRVMSVRHAQAWTDAAHEKWPGCTVIHVSEYRGDGEVSFTFPGGTAAVRWRGEEKWVSIAVPDRAAWETFTGRPVELITSPHQESA